MHIGSNGAWSASGSGRPPGAGADVRNSATAAAEEALAETSQRLNAIINNTTMAVFMMDHRQHCVFMNKAAEELTGYRFEETQGRPLHDVIHNKYPDGRHYPLEECPIDRAFPEDDQVQGEELFVHKDGHFYPVAFTASPVRNEAGEAIGTVIEARDITEEKKLYEALRQSHEMLEQRVAERTAELATANDALRQAQKMEAIGQLTGGIAHDFNNMLTVIRGSADVLQRGLGDEAKRQRYLQAIADTSDRAARLTSQLLAFARRQALKPEVFDVEQRVGGIADMLRTVLGSRICLVIASTCKDCFVEADSAQFETALVNMAVNARDAMGGEGELRIEVGRADSLPSSGGQPAGHGYVCVKVSDTGEGIAPDALQRIFEPFYTTKETGKGTGLGLSQVYGFANQSGGEIHVTSELGRGSTFTLYLPASGTAQQAKVARPRAAAEPRAEGCILVVEDNDHVGHFAEQVLAEIGFDTRRAASAAQALELLETGERFDLVFSDIVMPGQSGIELGREIRERWPDLPVVLTTGYSDALARGDHAFPVLHKPYSLEALASAIGQAVRR